MNDFVDQFNKVPAPQRWLILLVLMLGVFMGFYLLIYSGLEDEIVSQKASLDKLELQKSEIVRKIANKEEILGEIDELKRRKESVEKVLPKRAEIPQLLQKVYGQAKIVGMEIKLFEPGDEQAQLLYSEIPVKMDISGTYDQVADFFFNVGRMDRIVNIKNISIERQSGGEFGVGLLAVSLEATTYRSGGTKIVPVKAKKKKKKKK
jgi:type IV pilus assembly protein PilO